MAHVVVVFVVQAGLLGCATETDVPSGGGQDPTSSATPESLADCNHGPGSRGDDLQLSSGLHWLEDDHAYDEPGEIFVCINPEIGGTVKVTGPVGVDVSPAEQLVDPAGSGILRFEVRVSPGASGDLKARTISGDTSSTLFGPMVESSDAGWGFREGEEAASVGPPTIARGAASLRPQRRNSYGDWERGNVTVG